MAWLLETTSERSLATEDIATEFALPDLVDPSSVLDRITGPWPVESVGTYEELSPTFGRLYVTGIDGHRRALRVGIDAASPHRIRYASRFHAPVDVRVREATEADAAALSGLERRTPVIDAGSQRRYDRADWFGQLRLMDEVVAVVAEIDGGIVGVHADAIRTTRLGGHDYRMMYRFRTRVDPAVQGRHVFPALNGGAVDRRFADVSVGWGFDSEEAHVATGNDRVRAMSASSTLRDWPTPIERLIIDCSQAAGPFVGRPAKPADASKIAAILSRGRGDEVGYPETTTDTITTRLTRAPSTYGWSDLLIGDEAVIGIWDERTSIKTVTDGVEHNEAHAIAVDYACTVGHEQELVALVRAVCAQLAERGVTHLMFHTSSPARHRTGLFPLASRVELFSRRCRVAEPPLAPTNGIYVDPIHF